MMVDYNTSLESNQDQSSLQKETGLDISRCDRPVFVSLEEHSLDQLVDSGVCMDGIDSFIKEKLCPQKKTNSRSGKLISQKKMDSRSKKEQYANKIRLRKTEWKKKLDVILDPNRLATVSGQDRDECNKFLMGLCNAIRKEQYIPHKDISPLSKGFVCNSLYSVCFREYIASDPVLCSLFRDLQNEYASKRVTEGKPKFSRLKILNRLLIERYPNVNKN